MYMIDSDQHPDSNRHPLTSLSQITIQFKAILNNSVLSKFSDLWPIFWLGLGLGHTSVKSLDLRKWETTIDLRIGCRFENLKKKDIELSVT